MVQQNLRHAVHYEHCSKSLQLVMHANVQMWVFSLPCYPHGYQIQPTAMLSLLHYFSLWPSFSIHRFPFVPWKPTSACACMPLISASYPDCRQWPGYEAIVHSIVKFHRNSQRKLFTKQYKMALASSLGNNASI